MKRTPRLAILPLITTFLAISFPYLSAQQDVRLSPPRRRAVIATAALIQSAAALDRRTLVVWGATQGTIDDARPMLVMSVLDDTTAIGDPVRLTSLDARPSGYVQVVALADRFLVLWNDGRNGGSSAYMRVVTRDGVPLGVETRLRERWISPAGVFLTREGSGYRLLWSDAGPGDSILACSLSQTGAIASPVRAHAPGSMQSISHPGWLPGYSLIDRGDAPPLLVADNGEERPLGSAAGKFAVPYRLGDDGSVASLFGDTVRLYTSIFDTIPARVSVIPALSGAIPATGLVSMDKLGRIVVFHAIGGGVATGPSEALIVSLIRSVEISPGIWLPPEIVDGMLLSAPARGCEHASAGVTGVAHRRERGNRLSLTVSFEGLDVTNCPGEYSARPLVGSYVAVIGGNGEVNDTTSGTPPIVSSPPVERMPSDTASEVAVTIATATMHLGVPIPTRGTTYPCLRPGISDYRGSLVVSWLAAEEDTSANAGVWDPGKAARIDRLATISGRLPDERGRLLARKSRKIEMLRTQGQAALNVTSRWRGVNDSGIGVDRQMFSLSIPTDHGWREITRADTSYDPLALRRLAYTFDPVRHEAIAVWGLCDQYGVPAAAHVVGTDADGARAWGTDSLDLPYTTGFWAIPIGDDDFGYIDYRVFYRFRGGKLVESLGIRNGSSGGFLRMMGPRILRYIAGSTLDAMVFNLDGTAVNPSYLEFKGGFASDMFIVQNPGDSTLTFLSGSPQGVMMVRMDQDLNILQPATIISDSGHAAAQPAGLYRNDSLYVVWEDLRDSVREVYGRVVPPSSAPIAGLPFDAVAAPSKGELAHLSILPNPAGEHAMVTLLSSLPAGTPVTYTVIDLLGREMLSMTTDDPSRQVTIPTSELPGGAYLVRAAARGTTCAARFMVVH